MYIELIKNYEVIVDNKDILENRKSWSISKNKNMYYVRSGKFYLHRIVVNAKPGEIVDHINGNGLDNRLCNLRIVNRQVNRANSFNGTKSSKFIGVSLKSKKKRNKFASQIKINNKNVHLGYFENEKDAAIAYNIAAKKHYGSDFVLLNFIE
jgi:hypothetical protein